MTAVDPFLSPPPISTGSAREDETRRISNERENAYRVVGWARLFLIAQRPNPQGDDGEGARGEQSR